MKKETKKTRLDKFIIQRERIERKRFEEELRESEERYRIVFEKTPNPILVIDTEGNYLDCNEAALQFIECSYDELLTKNIRDYIIPLPDRQIYKEHRPIYDKGGSIETEYYINGKIKILELNAIPAIWRNRRVFFCMGKEVTERIQAEKKLYKTNELLERVFSNTHFLIAYMDTNFNFIRVNQTYAQADDHTPDFYIGKNYFDLYPNEEYKSIFHRVVETGKSYSVYGNYPERETKYWDWSLQPVKDSSGKVEGLVLCLLDITERKKAEEELIKTQKELIQAQRLSDIGTLAATVAHELRNPLGVILTAAYNIKRKRQNQALDKHIANIEKKVAESDQIINNLLSYSRIKMPHYEKILIYNLLDECINFTQNEFFKHQVSISKKFDHLQRPPDLLPGSS